MSQPSAEVYGKRTNSFHLFNIFDIFTFVFEEFLFKFLIIGSASTGKSSLLHQFLENKCKTKRFSSPFRR